MKKELQTAEDIHFLVDEFYTKVKADPFIGPIFNESLAGKWDMHHEKLYRFWNTVLFQRPGYFGDPALIHFDLKIESIHFDHWLKLWAETIDENFEGLIADRAKCRGKSMATTFMAKIKKQSIENQNK